MPQGSHRRDMVVGAKIVPVRSAKGCIELTELAAAAHWSPAPLEMVGFSLPQTVRQSEQTTLAQYQGHFHDVRLVAGMAGIGDIANGEYVCDSVYDNLGRLNNDWYSKYGLHFNDAGVCTFFCGKNEPLQVANAISFFGWENGNYAHWLSEKLGRFYWINQANLPQDTVVLLEAGLPTSIMDALAIFWPLERTICVQPGHACQVKVLHHFSDTADIWEPRAGYVYRGDEYHLYPTAIAWMACYVKTRCNAMEDQNKAYLIRPVGGNGRTIVNQQELIRQLNDDGFQAFQPEVRDFSSQVCALAACGTVVLGSGAAAANLLWMPQGATLVILIQDNPQMWYWFFHALAAAVGVRLVYHPVKGLPGTHGVIYHWSVEVPIGELRQWLFQDAKYRDPSLIRPSSEPLLGSTALQGELMSRRKTVLSDLPWEEESPTEPAPLVSVCIAAYNHESYIGEALESVLAQGYKNIEILVADDASTDNTASIIKNYTNLYPSRIRAVILTENEGPSCAVNRLFKMAQGTLIALLGSDDRMLPQRVEQQVAYLVANPGCVGVFSKVIIINAQGQQLAKQNGYEKVFNQPITHLRRQLLTGNFLNAPSAMIRRVDLLAVGGYDSLLRYVQDYDLWGSLLVRGDLARLPECLTEYRVHGNNLSVFGQNGPVFAARCETVETIVRFVRQWPLESILPQAPRNDQEQALAYLELAGILELVDRKFFGKPSLATAHAYQLILKAGRLQSHLALSAKQWIERSIEEGFPAQWKPFAWFNGSVPAWFSEYGSHLGVLPSNTGKLTHWLEMRKLTNEQRHLIKEYLFADADEPLILVVVLDLNGDSEGLADTINSLSVGLEDECDLVQILVLSCAPELATYQSDRLRMVQIDAGTYIETLNAELQQTSFLWVMLVQAGETFTSTALLAISFELMSRLACHAVYADELYYSSSGELGTAFRPSFNLDFLLSLPTAMAHHWLIKRDVFLELGGFDERYPEAFEFNFILRLIEAKGMQGIGHIDEPLVITLVPELKDNPDERSALIRHLNMRGYTKAELVPNLVGRYQINYNHGLQPVVSIIIPTKNQLPILQRCVESILEKTCYSQYEVLIVDNNSDEKEALNWLATVESWDDAQVRVLRYPHPFNYSAINNFAVAQARGEYLVLLNNDTAILQEDWLDQMLNHALRPEVGIVGAKLLYPDGRIQHAGVILGLNGPADHNFIGEPMDAAGYMNRLQVDQNYSAVTAACLMIRKELYEQVGGMDEELFKVSYNDVDLCLKVGVLGYLTVWTPRAVLLHEGSVSQTKVDQTTREAKSKRFKAEQEAMYAKWLPQLARDPAYNLNFSLRDQGGFALADSELSWRPLDSWRPLPVVLAHPADNSGCGHYRVIQPLNALKNAGLVDGSLQRNFLSVTELERYNPDTIILQRQIYPEQLETMRRMKAFSKAFRVYELDDYLPNVPLKSVHRQHMPKDVLKSLKRGISYSDRFVVSTEVLAEVFSNAHSDIRVVHNRLDPSVWENLISLKRQSRKPRVGWAGGVGHTGDLEMIADVVKALSDEVDWVFFGMCPDKLRPYIKEFHLGVPIEDYPQKLASLNLDLALAPLEQNLFNECKSNLRLLEYGACAVPVICSDVRCYVGELPVTRVKNRFRDWIEAVRTHLADLDGAAQQGNALQAIVQRDWMLKGESLASWQKAWLP